MGIPKFYRWLSERYPLINQVVNEGVTKPEFGTLSAVLRPFLVLVPAEVVELAAPEGWDLPLQHARRPSGLNCIQCMFTTGVRWYGWPQSFMGQSAVCTFSCVDTPCVEQIVCIWT